MKYYIIAGERSGDLHGSNLVKAIKKADNEAQIKAWGGDYMQEAGAEIEKHYRTLAFMGFLEVVKNLPSILGFMKECKKSILAFQPDALVLIDYAGFNMRIAKWAKKQNIKVFYYISPKVWAWNQRRAWQLKKNLYHLFVIFPFEVDFFKKYNFDVEYVGNPLLDAIENFKPSANFRQENFLDERPIIALLPGSRKQEVEQMLGLMLTIQAQFSGFQFVIAAVDNLPLQFYIPYLNKNTKLVLNQSYDLLIESKAALVTSGTATLETALFNIPQVVCYKTSTFSYEIAKKLIKVPFISLVNLVAQKEVVKELIQHQLTNKNLIVELEKITNETQARKQQLEEYEKLRKLMGGAGASERTGYRIVELLNRK